MLQFPSYTPDAYIALGPRFGSSDSDVMAGQMDSSAYSLCGRLTVNQGHLGHDKPRR